MSLIKPLPSDEILGWTKLNAFADDKSDVVKMMNSLLDTAENTVEKGENASYQHFLLFPHFFSKAFFLKVVKSLDNAEKN